MKLYNFFRSGTSHRLRIALNLKGIKTDYIPIDLRRSEHLQQAYKAINPQCLLPALVTEEDVLIQSPAIIEWLEEKYPTPALLPKDTNGRSHVRALAAIMGCDTHPLCNRRVLEYLRHQFNADENAIEAWCAQWMHDSFKAYESILSQRKIKTPYSLGTTPSLADVYLIPQVESAHRFKVDLTAYPLVKTVNQNCLELEAFKLAAPSLQTDAS